MSFIQRIKAYSQEQLEPFSRLFLSLVVNFFIYLLIKQDHAIAGFTWDFLVPSFGTFFLLIYYRISDEFKDIKTDEKFFPDRPIPSGRLFLSDLKIMLISVSLMSIVLNILFPKALWEFAMAFIFTVAMGKWFFMEKLISSNRLIAFFTHAPVGFFLYWYSVIYLLKINEVPWSLPEKLSVIAFIVLPGFSWEILRKTYLPLDEMSGYQIYSTMLGFRGSLLFGSLWVVLTLLNNILLVSLFGALEGLTLPLLIINLLLLIAILIHAIKPIIKNLKPVAELYMALHLLIPLTYLVYREWWS
jgi:4-hydroxybenzoate polyprenyltransferase